MNWGKITIGVLAGGAVGFLIAGPVGAGIGATLLGAAASTEEEKLTPKRQVIYQKAIESIRDPGRLGTLADGYDHVGLSREARILRNRAAVEQLTPASREQLQLVYKRALCSDKVGKIREVADGFESLAMFAVAEKLRHHAQAISRAEGADMGRLGGVVVMAASEFGPRSKEVASAARNWLRAAGRVPTDGAVTEVIADAARAVGASAAEAAAIAAPEAPA